MIITVTSYGGGQGASILSLELARQLGEKVRTLLIDLETLHPDLTMYLDKYQSLDFGIDAIFKREDEITSNSIDRAVYVTKENFIFLPGTRAPYRTEITHKQIRDLLKAADKYADIVVVDCPGRLDVVSGLHPIAQADRIFRVCHRNQAWKIKHRSKWLHEQILFERFNLKDKVETVWIGKKDEDIKVDWQLPEVPGISFDKTPREYVNAVKKLASDITGEKVTTATQGGIGWTGWLKAKLGQ